MSAKEFDNSKSSTSSESICDDDRDKDFNMLDYSGESSDSDSEISKTQIIEKQPKTIEYQHQTVLEKEKITKSISDKIKVSENN